MYTKRFQIPLIPYNNVSQPFLFTKPFLGHNLEATTSKLRLRVNNDHSKSRPSNFSTKSAFEQGPHVNYVQRQPKSWPKWTTNLPTMTTFTNSDDLFIQYFFFVSWAGGKLRPPVNNDQTSNFGILKAFSHRAFAALQLRTPYFQYVSFMIFCYVENQLITDTRYA
jgi:hypothetical protein